MTITQQLERTLFPTEKEKWLKTRYENKIDREGFGGMLTARGWIREYTIETYTCLPCKGTGKIYFASDIEGVDHKADCLCEDCQKCFEPCNYCKGTGRIEITEEDRLGELADRQYDAWRDNQMTGGRH